MPHKRPPVPVIILLVLLVIVGGYFLIRSLADKPNGTLTASGAIEAVSITISPEIGGRVAEVYVDEGDTVRAGDPLFRLDDSLLQAQRAVAAANLDLARAAAQTAQAALETARANYDLTLASVRAEAAATRTADWNDPFAASILQGDEIAAAQAEVEAAAQARQAAQTTLDSALADPAAANFVAAEARLLQARAAFAVAQDVLRRAALSSNADLRDAAQNAYDDARAELDDAQAAYDDLKAGDPARAVLAARAELAAAEERHQSAQDRLLLLQTGLYSPRLVAAQAAVHQAEAAAAQAELAVSQAEASLALIDAQIAKLTVTAPADGVILTRSVQPGEVLPAGAAALKLGRLDDLTITVYVPEDRYGELSLGQSATVTVDSFPGETFEAVIIHIADQAEFTPRNVQTVEGRSSTVYAVRLRVQDPDGKLKPGMPADVTFTLNVER
ncbi:MAG: efflux RND transporter periplasmic adaptor subunit [Anaerolineales bacterium]